MTSMKKLKKPDRDSMNPLLIVIRDSQRAAWKACADRAGMSLRDWMVEQLDFIAMAALVDELKGRAP